MSTGGFDAIVLAGGGARRLGGIDKTATLVGGRSLLARVLDSAAGADRVILCGGSPPPDRTGVIIAPEIPPGGGPAHGVAAALPAVIATRVVLLAADLPFVTPAAISQLLAGLDGPDPPDRSDGPDTVVAVDDAGREQFLLAAWDAAALRQVVAGLADTHGLPLRALYRVARVRRQVLGGVPPPWWDCDTVGQLATARGWSGENSEHDAG